MIYQEHESDTFTHNGRQYSLNKLFALTNSYPVENILVDDLIWIFEHSKKLVSGALVCGSCEVHGYWHEKRVAGCDVTVPVLITKHSGKLVVLDGLHRLERAMELNLSEIPAKMVDEKLLKECVK